MKMHFGLLGFGTVGGSVYRLTENHPILHAAKILTLETLSVSTPAAKNIEEITEDPAIGTVVELIGGYSPAYGFIRKALEAGKNVVTANKLVVSRHFAELNALAREKGVRFLYSASCGGGIPWLPNLSAAASLEPIEEVEGIMNGTTNYMLDRMTREGLTFEACLAEAQRAGFAEADPSSDIDGTDVLRKCVISANFAFGGVLDEQTIPTEGIRFITDRDIAFFSKKGLAVKLLARASSSGEKRVSAYVEPTLLPKSGTLASIPLQYNYLTYKGAVCGTKGFFGEGAGGFPTAGAVVRDLMTIASQAEYRCPDVSETLVNDKAASAHRYYLRTDAPAEAAGEDIRPLADIGEGFGAFLTGMLPPAEMKARAERIRSAGHSVFYAGLTKDSLPLIR